MKYLQLGALMVVTMLSGALSAIAAKSLPTNDFFTEGQTWIIERISMIDPDDVTELEVSVGEMKTLSGKYDYNGTIISISGEGHTLVVKEKGEKVSSYDTMERGGKIIVKASTNEKFEPFLDFMTKNQTTVNFATSTSALINVDYIYSGNLLRKRVKCNVEDIPTPYIFGIGTKEWKINKKDWRTNYIYRFISMTTAEGIQIDETVFEQPKVECDNSFWQQDKRWEYITQYIFGDKQDESSYYKVDGETELNSTDGSMVCPLYRQCESDWSPLPYPGKPVVSVNSQVYTYDSSTQRFMLEYDFNIEEGELALDYDDNSGVKSIDEITVKGKTYKRIIFNGADKDSYWKYWVEDIGANGDNTVHLMPVPTDGSSTRFGACYQGDECIFTYEDFFTPSGVEINETEERPQTADEVMYDLQGHRVKNPEPGEITISNGQKVIYR